MPARPHIATRVPPVARNAARSALAAILVVSVTGTAFGQARQISRDELEDSVACIIEAKRYVVAGRLVAAEAPREEVVDVTARLRMPTQSDAEARQLAEYVVEYVYSNWPLDPGQAAAGTFAECAQRNALPLRADGAAACFAGMIRLEDMAAARSRGVTKHDMLDRIEASGVKPEVLAALALLADKVYGWDGNMAELSLRELLACARERG